MHKVLLEHEKFKPILYFTGQHNTLSQDTLDVFDLTADYSDALVEKDNLAKKSAEIIVNIQRVVDIENPDILVVQGDTLSAYCGAYVSFLNKIELVHVEAGLRTYDKWSPFPEEIFRQAIDKMADVHFAPTEVAVNNLIEEGIAKKNIYKTGNTGIDALHYVLDRIKSGYQPISPSIKNLVHSIKVQSRKLILLTLHRRENQKVVIPQAIKQLNSFVESQNFSVVYPAHPSIGIEMEYNHDFNRIDSLGYVDFIWLMLQSDIVITDSGGLQEEAPHLGKPVLVVRKKTERVEILKMFYCRKYNDESLEKDIEELIQLEIEPSEIFGDGNSVDKIVEVLEKTRPQMVI